MDTENKFNSTDYKRAYNEEHYERFTLLMPKGMKDELKAKAKKQGSKVRALVPTS